jgi:glucose-6-phosphate 1-dehydrogenase
MVIGKLVLFGATGDLAGRFVFPALAALQAAGKLPEGFQIVAAGREDLGDDALRQRTAATLQVHATEIDPGARRSILESSRYRIADLQRTSDVVELLKAGAGIDEPTAIYLAVPPALFRPAITAIAAAGPLPGSRIVFEKPFGESLGEAVELNALLRNELGAAGAQSVYRVDHVLGMPTIPNLIAMRTDNRMLEAIWDGEHIEQIDILWEETLALESRAAFYDKVGALKDIIQSHVLQILSLVAMEPPASVDGSELHDRKVELLRSLRPPTRENVASRTRRARYGAGCLADSGGATGEDVPGYADEDGVDPRRGTETFAEIVLELDDERWSGTRFLLRAGKAMAARRKGVRFRFRPPARSSFDPSSAPPVNDLWIGVDGPNDITLNLGGLAAGPPTRPVPISMSAAAPPSELPAYGRVLLDILSGGSALSVGGDEAEEAWRVVTPVIEAWDEGLVPLEEYPAGSDGPQ